MTRRKKHIIAICLFLIGLSGCGSPSSDSTENIAARTESVQEVCKQPETVEMVKVLYMKAAWNCSMLRSFLWITSKVDIHCLQ